MEAPTEKEKETIATLEVIKVILQKNTNITGASSLMPVSITAGPQIS